MSVHRTLGRRPTLGEVIEYYTRDDFRQFLLDTSRVRALERMGERAIEALRKVLEEDRIQGKRRRSAVKRVPAIPVLPTVSARPKSASEDAYLLNLMLKRELLSACCGAPGGGYRGDDRSSISRPAPVDR